MLTLNEQPKQNTKNLKLILSALASVAIIGGATSVLLSNGKKQTKSKMLDLLPEEFSASFQASHYNKQDNWDKADYFRGKLNKWNDEDGEWSMEGEFHSFDARLERPEYDPRIYSTYLKDDKYFVISNTTLSCKQEYQHIGYALTKNALLNAQVLPEDADLDMDVAKRLNKDKNCGEDSEKIIMEHPDYGTVLACLNKAKDGLYGSLLTSNLEATFKLSDGNKYNIQVPKNKATVDGHFLEPGRDCNKGNKFQSQVDFSNKYNEKYINHVNFKFSLPVDNFPFTDSFKTILKKRQLAKDGESAVLGLEKEVDLKRNPTEKTTDGTTVPIITSQQYQEVARLVSDPDNLTDAEQAFLDKKFNGAEGDDPFEAQGLGPGGKGWGVPTLQPVANPVRSPNGPLEVQDCKGPCPTRSPTTPYPTPPPTSPPPTRGNLGQGIGCYWYHGAGNHKGFKKVDTGADAVWKKTPLTLLNPASSTPSDSSLLAEGMDIVENQTTIQPMDRVIDLQQIYSPTLSEMVPFAQDFINTISNLGVNANPTLLQMMEAYLSYMNQPTLANQLYNIAAIDVVENEIFGSALMGIFNAFSQEARNRITLFNGSSCHLRLYSLAHDKNYMCLEAFYKYMIIGGPNYQGGVLGDICGTGHFFYGNTARRMHNTHVMMTETAEYLCGERWCFFGNHSPEVVFTHSYGGMLTYSAFVTGYVKKGSQGTIAMNQPPLKGSPGAEFVHHMCKRWKYNGAAQLVFWQMQKTIWQIGYCDSDYQRDNGNPSQTNYTWRQGLRFQPQSYENVVHPDTNTKRWAEDYFVRYKYCGTNPCGMIGCDNLPSVTELAWYNGDGRFFDRKSAGGLFNSSTKGCKRLYKCYEMYCSEAATRCQYRGCSINIWGWNNDCNTNMGGDYGRTLKMLHDGMVNVQSCQGQQPYNYQNDGDNGDGWEGDQGAFYSNSGYAGHDAGAAHITIEQTNHEDGTGVNGNGYALGNQPVSWYINVVREIMLGELNYFNGTLYCRNHWHNNQEVLSNNYDCISQSAHANGLQNGNIGVGDYRINRNSYSETKFNNYSQSNRMGASSDDWYN